MRALFAALVFFALSCTGCALHTRTSSPKPLKNPNLVLSHEVIQNMFEIQREYTVETVRCLIGFKDKNTLHIVSLQPTWINEQSPSHVKFRRCASPNTVGFYHNHPGWVDENDFFLEACWFSSEADITTINIVPEFQIGIISCNSNTLVWYFKLDSISYRGVFELNNEGGYSSVQN